jgi:dihydrofolate reductase
MAILSSFMSISLNGFYTDPNNNMDFAHRSDAPPDPEFAAFTTGNAKGGGRLLFGHTTYEMMKSFWPTPQAAQAMPEVAEQMNALPKYVASRSMAKADWENTTVIKDLIADVARLKKDGPDITILGSGSIVQQLADAGLIDDLSVVVLPVTLNAGKSYLAGTKGLKAWKVAESRTFKNGNIFIRYLPA